MFAWKPRPVAVSANAPCTSSQARTQRPHEMQSSCWKTRYGWRASCFAARAARPPSAVRRRPAARRRPRARCAAPARSGSSERTSSTTLRRSVARARRSSRSACPRGTASCRTATGRGAPSIPTRQTRQAPNGRHAGRRSRASGPSVPASARRVERGRPGLDRRRSTPSTRRPPSREPQLVGEVGDQAADRRRHAAAVRAQAARPRASPGAPRASRGRPALSASTISRPRKRPMRQGKHLPQLSCGAEVQQVLGERAHVGALVEGDDAAVADHAALGGQLRRSRTACRASSRAGSRRAARRSGAP